MKPMINLVFISAGVKNGPLPKADQYIDCRGIPNPVRNESCPNGDGDNPKVQAWVEQAAGSQVHLFTQSILQALPQIPKRRSEAQDPYSEPYTVCFLCAHGIHRSRSMKHIIAKKLAGNLALKVMVQ